MSTLAVHDRPGRGTATADDGNNNDGNDVEVSALMDGSGAAGVSRFSAGAGAWHASVDFGEASAGGAADSALSPHGRLPLSDRWVGDDDVGQGGSNSSSSSVAKNLSLELERSQN